LNNFVIFQDSKVFSKNQLWNLNQVILKYKKTDVKIFCIGQVSIKTSNDKILQEGILIQAESVNEAMEIFEDIKELGNGSN